MPMLRRSLLMLSLIPGVAVADALSYAPITVTWAGGALLTGTATPGSFLSLRLEHERNAGASDSEAASVLLPLRSRSDFFVPHALSGVGRSALAGAGEFEGDPDSDRVQLVGEAGARFGEDRLSIPVVRQQFPESDPGQRRSYRGLGVKWQHSLNAEQAVTLSAQYGGYAYEDPHAGTTNRMAAVGWSGHTGARLKPRVSGSLFLGDEAANELAYRHLGRRYYGFAVDGSFSPLQDHSPYVSLRMQWSDYDFVDPTHSVVRKEEYSRLAVGWDWRVTRDWGLRAEANYSLNSANVDLYDYDRSRLFFGTRFDFR